MIFADVPGIGLVFGIGLFVGLICICADDFKKRKAAERKGMPLVLSLPGILLVVFLVVTLMACGVPYQIVLAAFCTYLIFAIWKYRKLKGL